MRVMCRPAPANTLFQPVTGCVRTTGCEGANSKSLFSGDPRGDVTA